jgi:hypothetical protein
MMAPPGTPMPSATPLQSVSFSGTSVVEGSPQQVRYEARVASAQEDDSVFVRRVDGGSDVSRY